MRTSLVYLGLAVACLSPIGLTLLLMPVVPSTQMWDSLPLSYALNKGHWFITAIGAGLAFYGFWRAWASARWWSKTLMVLATLLCAAIHMLHQTKMSAEAMFNEPTVVARISRSAASFSDDSTMYLWVRQGGMIAGYALDLVAHHHKIIDTVGSVPVMVTYCTMCHTGRVFSPVIDGQRETFRLVGANKFNAVFEDASTGSWWYQATGACVVGPRKGTMFQELESIHGTYEDMVTVYRPSEDMQVTTFVPDAASEERATWSSGYARTVGDTSSHEAPRSLVLGVALGKESRMYPLVELVQTKAGQVIRDVVRSTVEYRRSWEAFHP